MDEKSRIFYELLELLSVGPLDKAKVDEIRPHLDNAGPRDLINAVDLAVNSLESQGKSLDTLKAPVSQLINLMSNALIKQRYQPAEDDYLLSSLVEENQIITNLLEEGKTAVKNLNSAFSDGDTATFNSSLAEISSIVELLIMVDTHYQKKENVLFPWFETNYPDYRCVRLMWDIQDDARRTRNQLSEFLGAHKDDPLDTQALETMNRLIGRMYFDINANLLREEVALFPLLKELLPESDHHRLFIQTVEYGFPLFSEERIAWYMSRAEFLRASLLDGDKATMGDANVLRGRTGSLPAEVLNALFATIRMDMTFVNKDDKVEWFSDSPNRIFARSPAIIGRDVRNCHPSDSVATVIAILDAFKSGKKDSDEFWLNLGGKMVHIEYFALRDSDGNYLGTLECSQELNHYRELEGEKRLPS